MTTTTSRAAGQAPDLMYEPSASNIALAAMEVTPEHASYGIDPGGIGDSHLRGESLLTRRTMPYRSWPTGEVPLDELPPAGRRLRMMRRSAGLTQMMLSNVSGIPRTTIQSYEFGDINLAGAAEFRVRALAAALNVTPHDLLADDDVPPARVA